MTTVSFTFRRGGAVVKDIYMQSTWLNFGGPSFSGSGSWQIFLMILWLLMNCKILFGELAEMRQIAKDTPSVWRFCVSYFQPWQIVDWITVLSAANLVAFFFAEDAAKQDLRANIATISDGGLYDLTLDVMQAHERFSAVLYVYVLISLVRLFKGYSAQPRLGVVTSTMVSAASDTLHFLVVFSSVFFAYALAGVIVFGRHLPEFATLEASTTTCWRIVFWDFDYEKMFHVAPDETVVLFFSFMLLVVLIMLNMLLAIIMKAYLDVKANRTYARAETLYSQARESLLRFIRIRRGEQVSLRHIRDKLLERTREKIKQERSSIRGPTVATGSDISISCSSSSGVPKQDEEESHEEDRQGQSATYFDKKKGRKGGDVSASSTPPAPPPYHNPVQIIERPTVGDAQHDNSGHVVAGEKTDDSGAGLQIEGQHTRMMAGGPRASVFHTVVTHVPTSSKAIRCSGGDRWNGEQELGCQTGEERYSVSPFK
ncbi:unnamed protein product [Amoebophrya sp. A120]|nr:unnamed protein product [Amoebophrya sp. A120]|eukprot:GSA120T00015033001.1